MVRRRIAGAPAPLNVLDDPGRVATLLPPLRRRLLGELAREPDSAAGLARKLSQPRQKLNYHLRELERAGFLELHEERQRRGCVERTLRTTASAYLIDSGLLGGLAPDPAAIQDRFSSSYLIALAGRIAREVSGLQRGAERAGKKLPTLTLDTVVRFANQERRAEFAERLAALVAELAAEYQDDSPASRAFRIVLAGHPVPKDGAAASDANRKQEPGDER